MTIALLFEAAPSPGLVAPTTDQFAFGMAGIEAVHTLASIALNSPAAWPRYKVHKIGGFHGLADQDDPRFSPIGRMGERPLDPAMRRGKTITYEGDIVGRTLAELRHGGTFLRNNVPNVEAVLEQKPNVAYTEAYHTFCIGRATQYQGDDQQLDGHGRMPTPFIRPFVLAFRMSDPRFFYAYEYDTGWVAYDVGLANAHIDMDVKGGAPTEPLILVKGPARDIELRQLYAARVVKLILPAVNLAAGDQLTFNFAARTITRQSDLREVSGFLDTASDWWDADVPGLSIAGPTVSLVGTGMTVATSLRVQYFPATF